MSKRNNGTADYEILQNRFTAFICTSMSRARINYLKKESARTSHTYDMDEEKFALIPMDPTLYPVFVIPTLLHTLLSRSMKENGLLSLPEFLKRRALRRSRTSLA